MTGIADKKADARDGSAGVMSLRDMYRQGWAAARKQAAALVWLACVKDSKAKVFRPWLWRDKERKFLERIWPLFSGLGS